MPVKHWSFAGLLLTDWCSARCATCYLRCGPEGRAWMSVEFALSVWGGLAEASPHGCRVHLSGGEPFGDWPRLIELCERARAEGLGPLETVETNAFWATDERTVHDRLRALDAAGMRKLVISADPYHQQYVPIENCRRLAAAARGQLGEDRVQVRWRDWLAEGFDTGRLGEAERRRLFAGYAAGGRDRLNGRAAEALAPGLPRKPVTEFADNPCGKVLLRARHVHVDPGGAVFPAVCAGIVLGDAAGETLPAMWQRLHADHADRPVLATLATHGPVGLLAMAEEAGFVAQDGYAGKCHLCWAVRRHLVRRGRFLAELGPVRLYGVDEAAAARPNQRPTGRVGADG